MTRERRPFSAPRVAKDRGADLSRDVLTSLGGPGAQNRAQVSFLNGVEVPYGTAGSVRPDIVVCGAVSCEVKNYNLTNGFSRLVSNVAGQAVTRQTQLPRGMTQSVYIDIRGQTVSAATRLEIRESIQTRTGGIIDESDVFFLD